MMNRLLFFFSFLGLVAAVSHAALPAEIYWHSVLPKTPMPMAIKDLLRPEVLVDEKTGTSVNTGNGGVHVDTGRTSVNVGHGGVGVNVGGPGKTYVGVGHGPHGGVVVNTGPYYGYHPYHPYYGKPPVVVTVPYYGPFFYKYAATETQVHDDPRVALFFLEKDLHPGAKMNLHFTKATSAAPFLPRQAANSIPFSSNKLPEILNRFSVKPDSLEAKAMQKTLQECEEPAIEGETKHCATSLESMVEFSTSSLGTHEVKAVSTTVSKENTPEQTYTITSRAQRMAASQLVACHSQTYAYAVFYCHTTRATKAYMVPMVGKDGTTVQAVAVCHTDTAKWNPKHVSFQVLNVKPGTVPICHFLPEDHIVWSPNK